MKYAITAKDKHWDAVIDPRFGRTDFILIYDDTTDELTAHDNRDIENVAHGAGTKTAALIFELKPDVLITGNGPGSNAATALAMLPMKIFVGAAEMTVRQALKACQENKLKEF